MKIGVAGTGAVGGYFGGMLQKYGYEVVFLARGAHLEAMKNKGLSIETEEGDFVAKGEFTDSYQDFYDADLVLFCVKSMDTIETAEYLVKNLKTDAVLLTLQNGVDNEEKLSAIFGSDRVLSAATYVQAFLKEPGVVKQIGIPPRLVIGPLDKAGAQKAAQAVQLFNAAMIETHQTDQIIEKKWNKLLWNVTFNPLSALMEAPVKDIVDSENLKVTATSICEEAVRVARADGVKFPDEIVEQIIDSGKYARNHKTSMLQDRLKGKKMEIESICGFIIRRGKELGVETHVLKTIYNLLKFVEEKSFENKNANITI